MTRIIPTAKTLRDFILVFTAEYAALLVMCKMRGETIAPIAIWPLVLLIVLIIGLNLESGSPSKPASAKPRSQTQRSGRFS